MRLLGVSEPTFSELFTASKKAMVDAYPELEQEFPRILNTALAEEEAFLRTLVSGTAVLESHIDEAKASKATELSGDICFLLHDTYGFPIDLTLEIAEENGLSVNRSDFDAKMSEQRQRAKADAKLKKAGGVDLSVFSEFRSKGESVFTGYEELQSEAKVIGLILDGVSVSSAASGSVVDVILNRTSFYAESGGQSPDAGEIIADGLVLEVLDVQKPLKGLISHRALVKKGQIAVGDNVLTVVDSCWRLGAAQAHSATHVVHAALRQVLGPTALQSGSYNKPGYMRLDFSWNQALSQATKSEIEEVSNLAIRQDLAVSAQFMSLPEAKAWGAVALFGETYDESVRVVQIGGPWSRELCGGTHVSRSSQIGLVSITNESSVGSGSRRLEANVGLDAIASFNQDRLLLHSIAEQLKTNPKNSLEKVSQILTELKESQRLLAQFEAQQLRSLVPDLVKKFKMVGSINFLGQIIPKASSTDSLRELVITLRESMGNQAVVVSLCSIIDDKPFVIIAVNSAAQELGAKAGSLVKLASGILGGGGGGKDDFAQGAGTDSAKISEALLVLEKALG
jgi:alanyl-tRNA synthetase